MNARKRMQALLDGKIVGIEGRVKYKLDPDGNILVDYCDGEGWDVWQELQSFNDDKLEIIEEYPLTFKEAMQEAINGKKIVCNRKPDCVYCFNPTGKLIEIAPCGSDIASIGDISIEAKWKVVE